MHNDKMINNCRVCGLEQSNPPWGEDGKSPSYEFCACCGVEFGYQDCQLTSIRNYRDQWSAKGAKWESFNVKPKEWNLEKQLQQIAPMFR